LYTNTGEGDKPLIAPAPAPAPAPALGLAGTDGTSPDGTKGVTLTVIHTSRLSADAYFAVSNVTFSVKIGSMPKFVNVAVADDAAAAWTIRFVNTTGDTLRNG
jgi:hypothetical protein